MDDTGHTKYPVLFRVYVFRSCIPCAVPEGTCRYGGPTANLVTYSFGVEWSWYLACASHLKYIVVMVDGRGTMYRGRKLRNPVRGNLGYWEARDQVNAAKCVCFFRLVSVGLMACRIWAAKRYVDARRIGIWGWSYGGYLTLKTVELAAGVHSLAMAVAVRDSKVLHPLESH